MGDNRVSNSLDAPAPPTQNVEASSNAHRDAGFSHVGDTSSNQAWSNMTGSGAGGGSDIHAGNSAGMSSGNDSLDFSNHGDIYNQASAHSHSGMKSDGAQAASGAGHSFDAPPVGNASSSNGADFAGGGPDQSNLGGHPGGIAGGDAPSSSHEQGLDKGAGMANQADQSATYPLKDGGSLSLQSDNKAQVTDAKGQTQDYNYYSNNDNGWHTMYKDSQSPREISDSMRQFRIDPESDGKAHALSVGELTHSGMHSSKLSPADRDFVDKNVPEGSKPIGMGIHRQAWQTPDNKAVVVGPNDYRQEAPFLLPPEKTDVSGSGNKKAETFPLGENRSISKDDVDKFVKDWHDKGWEMRDNKISNFAKTSDGKMWRVDPDDIFNWNEK